MSMLNKYSKGDDFMPRNTLGDLNDHLFMQIERLNEEDLKGDLLMEEIQRAKAITSIAKEIIANGDLVLRSRELQVQYCHDDKLIPKMLEG